MVIFRVYVYLPEGMFNYQRRFSHVLPIKSPFLDGLIPGIHRMVREWLESHHIGGMIGGTYIQIHIYIYYNPIIITFYNVYIGHI